MSGRPHIDIIESPEILQKLMKVQKTILEYNKVQSLYLLKSEKVKTVREIAQVLSKGETTIHRWFALYRQGGMDFLLKERKSPGRPKKISVETAARIQLELRDPEGFNSYQEAHLWLKIIQGIESSYLTIYRLIRYELKAKLKVARPVCKGQAKGVIEEFKSNLNKKLKSLLKLESHKGEKYQKSSYWCCDESRFGLHTIKRRKLTLSGVKPEGKHQLKFEYFWIYGAVEPKKGRHFFYEFSHLDSFCFNKYLSLFSQAYSDELLILQLDNAPAHVGSQIEVPENIILLFQPPYCPEVNPVERLWEYVKEFLAWELFETLDLLRVKVDKILNSLSEKIVGFLTGWSWILQSLSLPTF